jgi:signal transduction histidine kinase
VRRVTEETRPTLSAHSLELIGCDDPTYVMGDEVRLEQVIQNLIGNAVKYSPDGGRVQVKVGRDADKACLTVRDHGIGIPPESHRGLFRRFYRADNAEAHGISGLGIGLFVVNEIVELHGGSIAVESEVGAGSSFTVRLPILSAPGA